MTVCDCYCVPVCVGWLVCLWLLLCACVCRLTVSIQYRTSPTCSALQWLRPEQTAGKRQPYLFSQCQVSAFILFHKCSVYICVSVCVLALCIHHVCVLVHVCFANVEVLTFWMKYKIATICFNVITSLAPPYISVCSSGAIYPFSHSSFLCWYLYVPHTY